MYDIHVSSLGGGYHYCVPAKCFGIKCACSMEHGIITEGKFISYNTWLDAPYMYQR